jgi:guanylate kinase
MPDGRRLTVLSGPSGVGKGSVVAAVRARYPHVWVSVSATTRAPRPGELDGVQYHFVDRPAFLDMIESGRLLEYNEHFGHLYGTPREPVLAQLAAGRPALLEIELQGARQVRARLPDSQFVFLAPPSWRELERRLAGRGTESDARIVERLDRARQELAAAAEFDAVLVNDDVPRAAAELVALIEAVRPASG